jgi:hypothetical protein
LQGRQRGLRFRLTPATQLLRGGWLIRGTSPAGGGYALYTRRGLNREKYASSRP